MIRSCVLAVLGAGLAAAAWAFSAGDPARGREFALENCVRCHDMPERSGAGLGPAFVEISASDTEAIKATLEKPHLGGGSLSRGDAADVIAFIASLRSESE